VQGQADIVGHDDGTVIETMPIAALRQREL
jgi:hypothetical protein